MRRFLTWLGFCDHHFGVVHKLRKESEPSWKGKLIQTCYECGKVKTVKVRL